MFKSKYHLGEMFGIPIYVDISFAFLLLAFMMSQSSIVSGATCAIILAISIVLHELGHSLTARLFGYRTRDITISLLGGCASLIALPRKGW
jgi:Zn-dependent protease